MSAHTSDFPSRGLIAAAARRFPAKAFRVAAVGLLIGLSVHRLPSANNAASRAETKSPTVGSVGPGVIESFKRRPSHNDRYSAEVVAASSAMGAGASGTFARRSSRVH